jgi:hypothetical protein
MSFNIVLNKKPVFQYNKNNKNKSWTNKWNEKDTQNCSDVPRFLANLYTNVGIVNCSSSKSDINKYLFTNLENAKIPEWEFTKSKLWTNNSTSFDWNQSAQNDIKRFVQLTTKLFSNLDDLLIERHNMSAVIKVKSE